MSLQLFSFCCCNFYSYRFTLLNYTLYCSFLLLKFINNVEYNFVYSFKSRCILSKSLIGSLAGTRASNESSRALVCLGLFIKILARSSLSQVQWKINESSSSQVDLSLIGAQACSPVLTSKYKLYIHTFKQVYQFFFFFYCKNFFIFSYKLSTMSYTLYIMKF